MCRFSLLMCTYNSEKTVDTAIQSCLRQTCEDWELLVLDNASSDACCEKVQQYADEDGRIRLIRSESNIGWAKGTSLLLEEATGKYMCFLAADDYLVSSYALAYVSEVIDREDEPPVVLVRHASTTLEEPIIDEDRTSVDYITIHSERPTFKLSWATDHWYYNSLFHFLNIDYLKKENVDFYDPYFGDNEGMAKLIVDADKVCGIYNTIYALTSDTSQTSGAVVADAFITMGRWAIIKDAVVEHGDFDVSEMIGIADYIVNLGYNQLYLLCNGCPVRDTLMNNRDISDYQRYRMVQETLSRAEINEMMAFCGPKDRISKLFDHVAEVCKRVLLSDANAFTDEDWLYRIIAGLYVLDGDIVRRTEYSLTEIKLIVEGLMNEQNKYCYGFTEVGEALGYLHEDTLIQICKAYGEGQVRIAGELESMATKLDVNPNHKDAAAEAIRGVADHIISRVDSFIS